MPDMTIVISNKESICVKPSDIPAHVADGFARATLRAVEKYFEDPAVMAEYEAWKSKRKRR